MAKQFTGQPMKATVKPGAVHGNQADGYINPNARTVAGAVGRHATGSPTAAKHAASGKGVYEKTWSK